MATTTISITITTPQGVTIGQVNDALGTYWGYSATLPDGSDNPQTKAQFVKSKGAQFYRESYIAAKAQADVETARNAAITAAALVTAE